MKCPEQLQEIICEILTTALLDVRVAARSGEAKRCEVLAHHVHNLPALLSEYRAELLTFYWRVEREEFIAAVGPEGAKSFAEPWAKLEHLIPKS